MTPSAQHRNWIFSPSFRIAAAAMAIVIMFALAAGVTQSAQAQAFTVLHAFTGGADGSDPITPVTLDRAGNVYGTAYKGGSVGAGTVFKLTPKGSNWIFNTLYIFHGPDGANPAAAVSFGADGLLYGSTPAGGKGGCQHGYPFNDCGVVYSLRPPATSCRSALCPWSETVLHYFTGSGDGEAPSDGALVFDSQGNLYGATIWGGTDDEGLVYQLTRSNGWTETVLHSLVWADGVLPVPGVMFDAAGNLDGAGEEGGGIYGCGTVFQLTPGQYGWTANPLYSFTCVPWQIPSGGIALDQAGNIYGKFEGNLQDLGGFYQLVPSGYGWTMNVIHTFDTGSPDGGWWQGGGPVFDRYGNLYDTTYSEGAYGMGAVFKLTPGSGGWTYTSLHDFTGGSDGANPQAALTIDSQGNLYGTARHGGDGSSGVVFKITP